VFLGETSNDPFFSYRDVTMNVEKPIDLLTQRKQKIEALRAEGINPFPSGFAVPHTVAHIRHSIESGQAEAGEAFAPEATFTVAGRMMAVNSFGKSAFIRFRDRTGHMQAYIRKDKVDAASTRFSNRWTSAITSGSPGAFSRPKPVNGRCLPSN
jgi:lysyl-tRNA synthetase, class II